MQVTVLLYDQLAVVGVEPLHVSLLEFGDLPEGFGLYVIGPDVHRPVPIGEEEHLAVEPVRLYVRCLFVGDQHLVVGRQVKDDQRGVLAAAVGAPFRIPAAHFIEGDTFAVGAVAAVEPPLLGELYGWPLGGRNGPQAIKAYRRAVAGTGEEDGFSVGGPATHGAAAGVPGQAGGDAAPGVYDVDGVTAVAVRAKGQPLAVRGEVGHTFHGRGTGDALDVLAVQVGRPYIGSVGEGDAVGAEVRLPEEPGALSGERGDEQRV